jgi:hypothetical protein
MGSKELLSSVFHFPAGIIIDSIDPSANELVIGIACKTPSMPCPECHQLSARIHGHYRRTVADLPCAGRSVILALTVRKFVCTTPGCPRRIFTERLPGLVQSYARMTGRLIALVQVLGLFATWPKRFKSSWDTAVQKFARRRALCPCLRRSFAPCLPPSPGNNGLLLRLKKPIRHAKPVVMIALAK